MVDLFNSIPWYFGVALCIALVLAGTLFFFYFINKVTSERQFVECGDVTSYTLNTLSFFYCIFVALVFMDVQTQHNQNQDLVIKESALLLDISNTGKTSPLFKNATIEKAVHEYAVDVMEVELPLMAQGKDYALVPFIHPDKLWIAISNPNPTDFKEQTLYHHLMARMSDLTDARFQRFASVDGRTNPFLWTVLIYGALIVIAASSMFSSKSKLSRLLLLGFTVSMIVLILLLIYSLDKPFSGPTAVSLAAFQEVIANTRG